MGRRTENDQCEKKIIYKSITRMGIFFQNVLNGLKVMIPYAKVLSYKSTPTPMAFLIQSTK